MTGFDASWLQRRTPFDAAARCGELARRFGAALTGAHRAPPRIVDLAAGGGANFMALAPVIGGHQDWVLIDDDPLLLAAQSGDIGGWAQAAGWHCARTGEGMLVETGSACWRVRAQRLDLARALERVDYAGCDGVTTSAFLDLVSGAWLDRLCDLLARHALPLLATLTVDGRREWHPALPDDALVHEAFRRHQARDKGFGPALGSRAVSRVARRLAASGYKVATARSDWRVGAEHGDMLLAMVDQSSAAAREAEPAESALITRWSSGRRAQIRASALTLEIGHLDLLALPPGG